MKRSPGRWRRRCRVAVDDAPGVGGGAPPGARGGPVDLDEVWRSWRVQTEGRAGVAPRAPAAACPAAA